MYDIWNIDRTKAAIWLVHRVFRRRDGLKRKRLLSAAVGLIEAGVPVFAALRTRASEKATAQGNYLFSQGPPEETLKEDVRGLLNGIETQSAYFERVNAVKKKIQQTFNLSDFAALSEVLQIRRDFWAASEIFLMEGIQELGPKLADAQSLETFQAEARLLLFKEGDALVPGRDPVELRLAIAREDALAFQAESERAVAAGLERSRFPSAAEIIAVPWSLVKAVAPDRKKASGFDRKDLKPPAGPFRRKRMEPLSSAIDHHRRARWSVENSRISEVLAEILLWAIVFWIPLGLSLMLPEYFPFPLLFGAITFMWAFGLLDS